MRIKILTGCSGLTFSFSQGETAEVTAELGRDLVNGGLAEEIKTASARTKAGVKDNAESE
mgnify:FL=1